MTTETLPRDEQIRHYWTVLRRQDAIWARYRDDLNAEGRRLVRRTRQEAARALRQLGEVPT